MNPQMCIFSLKAGQKFASSVCKFLNQPLADHEERDFEDGEHKIRSLEGVRNKDVYIVQSLYSDERLSVNDKLIRLLFFIASLKESAASKVHVVIPYLCYARKDRRTKPRDPVTTKYVARMLECAGVDHVVTMDVHNLQAYQNSFRICTDHLEARMHFVKYLVEDAGYTDVVVMSPDAGGMKRAGSLRNSLEQVLNKELPVIFMEKERSAGIVRGSGLVGNVADKQVVIIDDLISSGTTLRKASQACMQAGAREVIAMVTHGVFGARSEENLSDSAISKLVLTNTIEVPERFITGALAEKIAVIDVAPLVADCILRIQEGGSLTVLNEEMPRQLAVGI